MIRVFTELNDIKTQWDTVDLKIFLKVNFIQAFYKAHSKILHLFILDKNLRIYSHLFTLRFTQTKKYFLKRFLGGGGGWGFVGVLGGGIFFLKKMVGG